MKRYIYATSMGIIILGSAAIQSTFAANTNRIVRIPAKELSSLIDESERNNTTQQKGVRYSPLLEAIQDIQIEVSQVDLTESELQSLKSMTQGEREVFWAAKGITRPTVSGETITRATRIAQNQSRLLEEKKQRVERKIQAGEKLTRIEKTFARANQI